VSRFGEDGLVTVRFNKHDRQLIFLLRQDNEADYSIAAEMLKGGYEWPNFTPGEIIDGGANIGLFSILAAASFPHAKLICYEPDADNFELLSRNLDINNIDAECHRKGLWSRDTTLYYRARDSHTGNISENPEGRVPVDCIRPVIGPNCWLKLDIESSEYVVLPALMKAGAYPRWISIEIHNYSKDGHKLTDLLARHGYVLRGNVHASADESTLCAFRTHGGCRPEFELGDEGRDSRYERRVERPGGRLARTDETIRWRATKKRCRRPCAGHGYRGRNAAPSPNISCVFPNLTRACLTALAATKRDCGVSPRKPSGLLRL
jgi:FkbM family methyltransferase